MSPGSSRSRESTFLRGMWAAITGGIVVGGAMVWMGNFIWVSNATFNAYTEKMRTEFNAQLKEINHLVITTDNRLTRMEGQLGRAHADLVDVTGSFENMSKAMKELAGALERLETKVRGN